MKYIAARSTKNSDAESADFISINNCGAFIETEKAVTTLRPSGRMDFQLIYISQGTLELTENTGNKTIESGCVVLFRPHEPQLYCVPKDSTFYWIHFSGTKVQDMLDFFKERVYKIGVFPEFEDFCRESIDAFAAQKSNYSLFCAGKLISLIALLSQKIESDGSFDRDKLRAALIDMHTNFAIQRTNDEYAQMCGLSKSHFIRLFHKCTGVSPQKYRTQIAMHEAKHLLKSNSVSDTAYILGYSDVFYFSRVFKKTINTSPSEYKKQHRQQH